MYPLSDRVCSPRRSEAFKSSLAGLCLRRGCPTLTHLSSLQRSQESLVSLGSLEKEL
ncbi:rCG53558, isoform CRA_c [Rattus norvegicus]|uniref:RCG53558, isoform CRA_c n=1 Tax=Rattus norvegicus TaxID=10116 RepID=A6J8X2_RAT|nr:rCG53558, isoform CRA_c [Rattus norvegicus]